MTHVLAEAEKNIRNVVANKRKNSVLIPYKITDEKTFVYLQKRTKNAKRLPDMFGLFGGGAKNTETPEKALEREIEEELTFIPSGYIFLKKYESNKNIVNVFILKVDDDFENRVKVNEGEFGKFFSDEDALSEPKIIDAHKSILKDMFNFLNK